MAIKIKFDINHNALLPTFVLTTRSGKKLGDLPVHSVSFEGNMKEPSELFFGVHSEENGVKCRLWNQIKDLKLVYCPEWDALFEISIDMDASTETVKNITAKSLGEAELSNAFLYNIEINTETDILRDDYSPTKLYDPESPGASLLHRIMQKVPHYKIAHVDASIADIQRTFSFDKISIYNAFKEIEEELNCYFKIEARLGSDGKIERNIYVYDIESYCNDCGARDEFYGICPECGSTNVTVGYGKDTTIFASKHNLAENINYSVDVESIKNCYRMSAGDDLMTATITNCNPNGSSYLWRFSDEMKEDMSSELVRKLEEYDELYDYYYNEHIANIPSKNLSNYNSLIEKYSEYSEDLSLAPEQIIGYPQLMELYYNSIDFKLFLESGLMPNVSMQETNAELEAQKLTAENIQFIAVSNVNIVSAATASSAALSIAKTIVDSRYQLKVNSGTFESGNWIGNFTVTNYSDDEDAATSDTISIPVTDDYESFVQQKIDKTLSNNSDSITDINSLFKLEIDKFKTELRKYSLNRLISYNDACQACLNVLIEQGISNQQNWADSESDLYTKMYLPYYNKFNAIQEEIKLREQEISVICGVYDSEGNLTEDGLQTLIESERTAIQRELEFESFMGEELWLELVSYRREDTYENSNYISDSLSNAELIKNAMEFIDTAKKEIKKASEFKHTITSTLRNLLVMNEFAPLVDHFELGNWMSMGVDNTIYRLRLTKYKIDFDDLDNIEVEFSDAKVTSTGVDKAKRVIAKAAAMAVTYNSVAHKAELGKIGNEKVSNLVSNGISASEIKIVDNPSNDNMSWGTGGFMLKSYDDISEEYDPCQMKMYNSSISLTDNNWETSKTAIGGYYYIDPKSGELKYAYGVNAEVLIGKLILGEHLGIYNEYGSMSFDGKGFLVTNGVNSFNVDPNNDMLMRISNGDEDVFYVDKDGRLHINADGSKIDIIDNDSIAYLISEISYIDSKTAQRVESETKRATEIESKLESDIKKEISRSTSIDEKLTDKIDLNTNSINSEIKRAKEIESSIISRIEALESKLA